MPSGTTRQIVGESNGLEKNSETELRQKPTELSQAELKQIEQLEKRDREVKAHEMAHKANAGLYARGTASFEYQIGPDGKRYAFGGEVSIDISKESDPQKTLEKAQVVRRAALAPAEPSSQDRQIARQAAAMAVEARQELLAEKRESGEQSSEGQTSNRLQSSNTASGRRALNVVQSIANTSPESQENLFDQYG